MGKKGEGGSGGFDFLDFRGSLHFIFKLSV